MIKVFLSYSNVDKELAGKIKNKIEDYGLTVFLAHEDIEPLEEWVERIRAELEACDIFIPILTKHFYESEWTDQETGIAFTRNKLIIPLKVSDDPYGFISHIQALKIDVDEIGPSCYKLAKVIVSRPAFVGLFRDALIKKFGDSWSFDDAGHNTNLLLSFEGYTLSQVTNIIKCSVVNSQINGSFKAKRKLNNFINKYKDDIDSELLQAFYKAIQ